MFYISKKKFEEYKKSRDKAEKETIGKISDNLDEYKKKRQQIEQEKMRNVLFKIVEDCDYSPNKTGNIVLRLYSKLKEEDSNIEN